MAVRARTLLRLQHAVIATCPLVCTVQLFLLTIDKRPSIRTDVAVQKLPHHGESDYIHHRRIFRKGGSSVNQTKGRRVVQMQLEIVRILVLIQTVFRMRGQLLDK